MALRDIRIFSAADTHGRALRPENRLIARSDEVGWRSLHAAIFNEAPLHVVEPAVEHPFLIYHLTQPTVVTRQLEGMRPDAGRLGPRHLCITPPDVATTWKHEGHPEILQVYLRRSVYEAAVGEMFGCDASAAEIVPRFGLLDPLLEQLAITLVDALRTGSSNDGLYIDAIAHMMAVHIARTHSARSRGGGSPAIPSVSRQRMQRLLEFIDANLDENLSLDRLATEAGISPLYLARAFKRAVGHSPHQYLLRRRVERAKELLRTTELPVLDVALAAGFSSQSHLSYWMIRQVGVSPAAYRRGRDDDPAPSR